MGFRNLFRFSYTFFWLAAALASSLAFAAYLATQTNSEDLQQFLKIIAAVGASALALMVAELFRNFISGLQKESKEYARKISSRTLPELSAELSMWPLKIRASTSSTRYKQLRSLVEELKTQLELAKAAPPAPDTSSPDKIFHLSRQRLLDEAVRIDSISRRNLGIGILFSAIALAVLAWPLVAQAFVTNPTTDVTIWAMQYYLPRFAVGLLLQFVGFFFLRLYVANELDLKHNKNEITNLEMKVMGIQLAVTFKDAASKKEIIKSLGNTERNFIIKKNEKSVSMEALSEYNDLKNIFEKLIGKIPGVK